MTEPQKLLLIGLDYAGKTSILKVLTQKYRLMESTKPTVGIERERIEILGTDVIIWDLGGQEKYRTEYLSDIRVFAETQTIFFVIDILSPTKYELALQYFTSILIMIESLGQKPQINLCLHKVDPDLQQDPETQQQVQKVRDMFLTNSRGFNISIFNTSIYNVRSIIRAFTETFRTLIPSIQPFEKVVQSIVSLLRLDGAMLFDEHLMLLSEFYNNVASQELCLNTVYEGVRDLQEMDATSSDKNFINNFESHINQKNKERKCRVFPLKVREWNLFLLTVGTEIVNVQLIQDHFTTLM